MHVSGMLDAWSGRGGGSGRKGISYLLMRVSVEVERVILLEGSGCGCGTT